MPPESFDFNFPTADPTELHPALRRIVEEERQARAQAEEARIRSAVQLVVREELKQVLDDARHADACGLNVLQYVTDHLQTRMDAAAEKAREGR